MNTGLKASETRTPVTRQSIHTGNWAPARLITGSQPATVRAEEALMAIVIDGASFNGFLCSE